jgi:hypothetical protein
MVEKKVEKKVVSRTVAIALGVVCIILVAGLGGAIAYYTTTINGKDNTITTITNQKNQLQTYLNGNETLLNQTQRWLLSNITAYDNYVNDHSYTDEQYQFLQTQYNILQFQYSNYVDYHSYFNEQYQNLTNIVNLANSTTWVNNQTVSQGANSYTDWTPAFSASYAGYVSVNVLSSTTTNTYVEVIWSAYGIGFDNKTTVGTSGKAVFPVLPASVEIRVGNTNLTSGATETITITYYY